MKITRTSPITGITHTLDIDCTQEQLDNFQNGTHLQAAFPNLNAADREFIHTGITDEECQQYIVLPEEEMDETEEDNYDGEAIAPDY